MWVLGIALRSSVGVAGALNHWTISAVPHADFKSGRAVQEYSRHSKHAPGTAWGLITALKPKPTSQPLNSHTSFKCRSLTRKKKGGCNNNNKT